MRRGPESSVPERGGLDSRSELIDWNNGDLPRYESTVVSSELKSVPIEIAGVSVKVLCRDPRLGLVVLAKMAAGATIPEH
jgi:hypothetical protein